MSADAQLVVAIDGPSGVGKSTAARELARRLGVPYLDTGAMYRSLGLKALREGLDPADRPAAEALAETTEIGLRRSGDGSYEVLLDGEPVGEAIRTPEVSTAASAVAVHPGVRQRMVALQRATAQSHGGVLEGRDIGTRVFPETPFKFFLEADPKVRAERRFLQLQEKSGGEAPSRRKVAQELADRDHQDSSRGDSPLTCDASYHRVDSTSATAQEVVAQMLAVVRSRQS